MKTAIEYVEIAKTLNENFPAKCHRLAIKCDYSDSGDMFVTEILGDASQFSDDEKESLGFRVKLWREVKKSVLHLSLLNKYEIENVQAQIDYKWPKSK